MQHQRDAGIAQRVDPGADRETCGAVERGNPIGCDAELLPQIEGAAPRRQLQAVRRTRYRLETRISSRALDQTHDVFVENRVAETGGNRVDELIAAQHAQDVAVVENGAAAGQAQGGAGDEHGRLRSPRAGLYRRIALLFLVFALFARRSQTGGVESAQRLVETRNVAGLGMVRKQRQDIVAAAENILDKPMERLLRANLDKHAGPGRVQRPQSLDELHRRGDLPRQNVEHGGRRLRTGGIERSTDVGDHRQLWRPQPQTRQRPAQRLTGGRDNRCVERVADR